ncbi:MAG: flagellar protein FlaI [Natronomonas sp.]|jgi:flagellar protein FlaI|uniref:type II/IV secretion system ATPase subunit n=1 Tax=Natronomonas sp. TaxID=2184060 RepID=UPI003989028B
MSGDVSGSHDDARNAVLHDVRGAFDDVSSLGQPAESFLDESLFEFRWPPAWTLERRYWVNEPFAHVAILRNPETRERRYHLTEPALDDFEAHVRQDVADRVRTRLLDAGIDPDDVGGGLGSELDEYIAREAEHVAPGIRQKIGYYLRRDLLGYGTVDPFMRDPAIEDLHVGGADLPAFIYHDTFGNVGTNRSWDADRLDSVVVRLAQRAGRHLSASRPLLTTTLPDGSRLQVTLGTDVATHGSNITLRKFREEPFTPPELINYGTFSIEQMAYLWLAIEHNCSVLFIGPTASGKTTSMNASSLFVPPDAKIVSIEETREVNLPHDNWIATVTRETDFASERPGVGTYELLSEALHQRPTHIIVGEIRTDPDIVFTFFQAMGTGHAGFTTFHADTARDAVRRLRNDPLSIPDELVSDIDIISLQHQMELDGELTRKARTLTEVREPDDPDVTQPRLHRVFEYDARADVFEQSAASRLLRDVADRQGWTEAQLSEELQQRRQALTYLVENGITAYEPVTAFLFRFGRDPETVLDRIESASLGETTAIDVVSHE